MAGPTFRILIFSVLSIASMIISEFSRAAEQPPQPSERLYLFFPNASNEYYRFEYKKTDQGTRIPLDGLTVNSQGRSYTTGSSNLDLRRQLLTDGLAIDPNAPSVAHTDILSSFLTTSHSTFDWLYSLVAAHLGELLTAGAFAAAARFLWRRFRARNMETILVGDIAAGKTVLCNALLNEKDRESDGPSEFINRHEAKKIPLKSHLEVQPFLVDTPGKKQGLVIKHLGSNSFDRLIPFSGYLGIIIVLAPVKGTEDAPNVQYIYEQLGILRNQASMIFDSGRVRKPDAAILFINKADALQDGGNSVSSGTEITLQEMFSEHIEFFETVFFKQNQVKVRIVVGSALQGWESRTLSNTLASLASEK